MANDFLSQLLAKKSSPMDDSDDQDSGDQDLMSQIAQGAPPIKSELDQRADKRAAQILAPSPNDRAGGPQINPLDARQIAQGEVSGQMAQEESDRQAQALADANRAREAALLQRKIMMAQGAPEDTLPAIPDQVYPPGPKVDIADLRKRDDSIPVQKPKEDTDEDESDEETPDTGIYRKESAIAKAKQDKPSLTGDTENELDAARKQSNLLAGLMMLGKGTERIGAGIARVNPDDKYLDEMKPLINKPVEDVLTKQKAGIMQLQKDMASYQYAKAKTADDPNSPISQFARDSMQSFGDATGMKLSIPEDASYSDLEKIYPQIVKMIDAKGSRDARLLYAQQLYANKQQKMQSDARVNFEKQINSSRAPDDVKLARKNMQNIKAAEEIFNQYPNLNDMPSPQVSMLVSEIAKVSGGGAATQHSLDQLGIKTGYSDFQKGISYLANHPTGANAAKFLKQYQSYLSGLKNVQSQTIADFERSGFNAYKNKMSQDDINELKEQKPYLFDTAPKASMDVLKDAMKIRRKSDGAVKTLPFDEAQKYLNDPNFEVVK